MQHRSGLTIGDCLGPYKLLAEIGRGGMGVVYRARDCRLGRDVGLKVLAGPADAERASRLLAEARAAAAVSHPNLLAIHDVGTDEGVPFIVSELIDGIALRARMTGRGLPVSAVLPLMVQIADALAAAHRAGLVHGDLKPDNVLVSPAGRVTLIDFGLARWSAALETGGTGGDTLVAPHLVAGTPSYMSPEQARGAAVDARSDLFAFGAVAYEMLTGRRAFAGATPVETLAAVLHEQPSPLSVAAPTVPARLAEVIERCLAKSPADRYAATDDLAHDLRLAEPAAATPRLGGPAPGRHRAAVALAAAVVTAVSLAAARATGLWPAAAPPALPRWTQLTAARSGFVHTARFSPTAQEVLFSAAFGTRPVEIYATSPGAPGARQLDVPPAGLLAVSSSGTLALSLGCQYNLANGLCSGTLAEVPLLGGAPRALAENVWAADWGPRATLAVAHDGVPGPPGAEYPSGSRLSEAETTHVRVGPDGRVAWVEQDAGRPTLTVMARLPGASARPISARWLFVSGLAWAADGSGVYVTGVGDAIRDDAVLRVGLDGSSRIVLSGPSRLRLLDSAAGGRLLMDVSRTFMSTFVWEDGGVKDVDLSSLEGMAPDVLSDDGLALLFTERTASIGRGDLYEAYFKRLAGGEATRIGSGYGAALSPDGKWAVLRTRPEAGPASLVAIPLGTGTSRTLDRAGVDVGFGDGGVHFASPDTLLLRGRPSADGPWRTYRQSVMGGSPMLLAHDAGAIVSPVAPDGDRFLSQRVDGSLWLARVSGAPSQRLQWTLAEGQVVRRWTADGRGIYVAAQDHTGMNVARVDLASGRSDDTRHIPDTAPFVSARGRMLPQRVHVSADGRTLVVGTRRIDSLLYLVDGLPER